MTDETTQPEGEEVAATEEAATEEDTNVDEAEAAEDGAPVAETEEDTSVADDNEVKGGDEGDSEDATADDSDEEA